MGENTSTKVSIRLLGVESAFLTTIVDINCGANSHRLLEQRSGS